MDQFLTWAGLTTQAAVTGLVLVIIQFIKVPLGKWLGIPTRLIVYIISAAIMAATLIFTGAFSWSALGLVLLNAVFVALGAMGTYEAAFAAKQEDGTPPDAPAT